MADERERIVHQPIHPDVRPRLDPEYVSFHDKYLQYAVKNESVPWDPASRNAPAASAAGRSAPVEVGDIRDLDRGDYQLRVFTPKGSAPRDGWPVFVWFHGGGWVMGGLGSENSFLTVLCSCLSTSSLLGLRTSAHNFLDASCVVVSVNYRHAPEHVYPAAINDSFDGFAWIVTEGAKELGIDSSRVAVGGLSA